MQNMTATSSLKRKTPYIIPIKIKVALVSSASHFEIKTNLKNIGIPADNFDAILSGKEDLRFLYGDQDVNKPCPYIYELCARKLKLNPKKCLVFEDTDAGVTAA